MDDALKTRSIEYLNVETWLLFAPPPVKISGYAPVYESIIFEEILRLAASMCSWIFLLRRILYFKLLMTCLMCPSMRRLEKVYKPNLSSEITRSFVLELLFMNKEDIQIPSLQNLLVCFGNDISEL